MTRVLVFLVLIAPGVSTEAAESWFDALLRHKATNRVEDDDKKAPIALPDFGRAAYTVSAWIKTSGDGSIFSKCAPEGRWSEGGKSLFISRGKVCFDIGWVGEIEGRATVTDGRWHHVALCGASPQKVYVDGRLDATGELEPLPDAEGHVVKLGATASDFPEQSGREFNGLMDDVRIYGRVLSQDEIRALAASTLAGNRRAPLAWWPMDGDARDATDGKNHAEAIEDVRYAEGKFGKAARLAEGSHLVVPCGESRDPGAELWRTLAAEFSDETSRREMAWEREDGIWGADWKTAGPPEIARRYAEATVAPSDLARRSRKAAAGVRTADDLRAVRALYIESRRHGELLESLAEFKLPELRQTILSLHKDGPPRDKLLTRLDALETRGLRSESISDAWKRDIAALRRDVLLGDNRLIDFDRLVFIRRQTYHSSHFYTDFIDGVGRYGGNLCILDLPTGEVTGLLPEMAEGIFGRFDLSFDARKIVFDWKKAPREGFRIFEVGIDGRGLRQLTFPPDDEEARIAKYDNSANGGTARMYYHQTDDMHPCYLPDGGVMFTSTRCEYGTLCDGPDHLTTAVLHRIDGDGRNMQKLTNSAVSEFSPSVMHDGWVLYTRWEYVDKGQLGIKCLWAMRPDGSGSKEIFGNDIQFPPTLLHGRQIPGESNQFVVLGTPHYPQSGIGTVIRLDTTKDIRTREPMTYITPHVDIRQEPGWNHLVDGQWVRHTNGPLYMDPFPLDASHYLVAYNPDRPWDDPSAYGLYLIDEAGSHALIHQEGEFSCWQPTPLRPRRRPPMLPTIRDDELARKNLAVCVVENVHHGMEGVEPGEVKYLRVMEQIPRPWAARRFWGGDAAHTSLISRGSALAAKAMYGVVPVHEDGSAHFLVPADRNIYFSALDEHFMELQRERTYVNYRPGETRACVGCHEKPGDTPPHTAGKLLALQLPPSMPQAQPGDDAPARALHYPSDVQPVLDRHCVRCHGAKDPADGLNLTGELTATFSRSYESILGRRLVKTFDEGSDWGGTPYAPPRSVGSHASPLIAQVRKGCPGNDRELPLADFVKLATWVDANAVYYGAYWGRKNLRFRDHPNFRPVPTFEQAISTVAPLPEDER